MKKLILTAALAGATALSGFSQGEVNFQNTISTHFYFNSTASTSNAVSNASIGGQTGTASSGVVDVGLYWSTAAFTDSAQATLGDKVLFGATPGLFVGSTSLALTGAAGGSQVYVQVYAWDSTYATPDAALAANAFFGASSAGQNNTTYGAVGAAFLTGVLPVSPAPGTQLFGTAAPYFARTVLLSGSITPEPATIAIGGFGAAALLLFRRRK
jgi:hypothetical protein